MTFKNAVLELPYVWLFNYILGRCQRRSENQPKELLQKRNRNTHQKIHYRISQEELHWSCCWCSRTRSGHRRERNELDEGIWYSLSQDAYTKFAGHIDINAMGCVTGKAINQGGIPGRTESTGLGVFYATREILEDTEFCLQNGVPPGLRGKNVIIQGFGAVLL